MTHIDPTEVRKGIAYLMADGRERTASEIGRRLDVSVRVAARGLATMGNWGLLERREFEGKCNSGGFWAKAKTIDTPKPSLPVKVVALDDLSEDEIGERMARAARREGHIKPTPKIAPKLQATDPLVDDRRQAITLMLSENPGIKVADLARHLELSLSTIGNDLRLLANWWRIHRVSRGVYKVGPSK